MILFLFPQPPNFPTAIPPPSAVLLPRCCPHCRSHCAAATALPPSRCALPPLPLTLPPPQRCRQAAANIPLSCCRHRLAAAKLPPTSRCRAAATAAASALLPPHCHRRAVRRRCASRFRRRRLECWVAELIYIIYDVFFSTCFFLG